MGKPKKYTKKDVINAINGSGAIVSTIAKRLDCTWDTAKKYIHEWQETKQAFIDEEETVLDMCESTLYTSVKGGDTQSAKWILATKGKRRGFTERHEITGAEGENLKIEVQWRK